MKRIPISKPYLDISAKKNLYKAIESTWISSQGKYLGLFEKSFSKFNSTKYSLAVSNGSVALILSLKALDIKYGDEVIVPNITFSATINSIINVGAKPVLVDINNTNWTIDSELIEKKITKKTKAIIVVHLYGNIVNLSIIKRLAKKYKLKIIEDCAEAHGATYNGKKVGNFSDIGCFSFYGNKIFTTGEGGICCTNKKKIFKKLKILRDQGLDTKKFNNLSDKKYYCNDYGFNFRMTNLQAAIGFSQIKRATQILNERKLIFKLYKKYLSKNIFISYPKNDRASIPVNWLFTFTIKKKISNLMKFLDKYGIETRPIFYPFNKTKIYKKFLNKNDKYTNSENFFKFGISLPTYNGIKKKEINYICDKINKFCNEN